MRKPGISGLSRSTPPGAASATSEDRIDIPYTKFILPNGLTLLVHEDHKAPIVAVNVWYHVGSKNEKLGKTGFAHLFEHLMFNGSENFDDDYFQGVERLGATDLNGTTNEDRTNYFQNVPTPSLDTVLWLESDRMGHLLGAVTQDKLDEQRGVVQNEKRQHENEPYAVSDELIVKATYPAGHPYSWTVIGSMEDISGASLDDVHGWFKAYYGAANAVLSIAGDVDTATVREKVAKYFGDIPPGPPIARFKSWVAKRSGTQRQVVEDRVPQARIYKVWNVPPWESEEADLLDLAARVLSSGKTSRLFKRLVYDDQIATSAVASLDAREIGSQFRIEATARPAEDLAKVERALDEELARFLHEGPSVAELERVKTGLRADFVRGVERIGGFGGKSDILAVHQIYAGNPEHYKVMLERLERATPESVRDVARVWLSDGDYVLEVHPLPEREAAQTTIDRSQMPVSGKPEDPRFPDVAETTLSNGLRVLLAERHAVPVVELALLADAGYAADQFAHPGTASLAMRMLDEGTTRRTSLQISEQLADLGAELDTGSNLDVSMVTLSALRSKLDASLDLFADVILNPSFPPAELERLRKEMLAGIQREKVGPVPMALRVFPALLYGKDHPYGLPFTGTGTEETVARITREDLVTFHREWFCPNNCTLVVTGAITMDEMLPRLEERFRGWKKADVRTKGVRAVEPATASAVYLVDRPGSIQSILLAGQLAPPRANPDEIAIETINAILGGMFTARLNMNLREDKHWTYGAGSFLPGARGQRPFLAFAPVQADKTKEAMIEMRSEFRGMQKDRPVTADELAKAQGNQTLALPGSWETAHSVASSLAELVIYGLPEDWYETYAPRVRALTVDQLARVAGQVLRPDKMVWVVVGDRSVIEQDVRDAGFGEVRFLDADGNLER